MSTEIELRSIEEIEAVIFRNIFDWLLYLSCFIYYRFPNSYRIIQIKISFT